MCNLTHTIEHTMVAGGQNDDCGGGHIRRLLAAAARLLHQHVLLPGDQQVGAHIGGVSDDLLAGHEQHHVQSVHLLLDEPSVSHEYFVNWCEKRIVLRLIGKCRRTVVRELSAFEHAGHDWMCNVFVRVTKIHYRVGMLD